MVNFFYYCKFRSTMLYLDLIIKTSLFSRNAFDDRAYCQVCWMFRFFDEISAEERQVKAQEIKEKTEALKEQIAGIRLRRRTEL